MKEFTISPNDAGQRLDRWLAKTLPLSPASTAQKCITLIAVKTNGKVGAAGAIRATRAATTASGGTQASWVITVETGKAAVQVSRCPLRPRLLWRATPCS